VSSAIWGKGVGYTIECASKQILSKVGEREIDGLEGVGVLKWVPGGETDTEGERDGSEAVTVPLGDRASPRRAYRRTEEGEWLRILIARISFI
jgi:hypothetical protein